MRRADSGVFVALLLFFLLLLAAPVLFFLYGYGFLQLPKLTSQNIAVAATAGLFIIPVFLVFLAAVIKLAAKRKRAAVAAGLKLGRVPVPEHYPWEDVFGPAGKEEFRAESVKVKAAFAASRFAPKLNATALVVAAVIVAATVVFFMMVVPTARDAFTTGEKGSNQAGLANLSTSVSADSVVKNESTLLQFLKARLSNLRKANETRLAEEAKAAEKAAEAKKLAEAEKKAKKEAAARQKQEEEAKQKEQRASSFSALAAKFTKFKATASKAAKFWPYALAGIGVLVMLAGGFYAYKAKKIRPAIGLLKTAAVDSAKWLAVLLADARANVIKIVVLAIAVAAFIAAFVFRDWLGSKASGFGFLSGFPGSVSSSVLDMALAVRDFFSAYRLYIAIGIVALLVILAVLFVLERRGKALPKP